MGMLIFVVCETMFFAGLISGHTIVRSAAPEGLWPPLDQPRLPVGQTAFNTAALLLSGALLFVAARRFKAAPERAVRPALGAALLGLVFVGQQGVEWAALLKDGLTFTSSNYGSFFYMIVGTHAVHAVAAIGALLWALRRLRRGTLTASAFGAVQVMWLFVVGMWPVIYARVYF
jgi:cytochrome c oxidase subunit 3